MTELRSGPLGKVFGSFLELLEARQHPAKVVVCKLWQLVAFGEWMAGRAVVLRDLDETIVQQFLRGRGAQGKTTRGHRATLGLLLGHLRKAGLIPAPACRTPLPLECPLVAGFRAHLVSERGLAPVTVSNYLGIVGKFVSDRFGDGPVSAQKLGPADSNEHIRLMTQTYSPRRCQLATTALKVFFRYLRLSGQTQVALAASVPKVANWRLANVPKYLPAVEVEQLLSSCARDTPTGRRNYAVLLLLARLGLRAGEVRGMRLNDIDWDAGELLVRGKGGYRDRLPLPPDVGEALVAYLSRGRPPSSSRSVFLCARAPFGPVGSSATLGSIVSRALRRAGLEPPMRGAHLLRHSLATRMLREGSSLPEIAELLRHRALSSTEIYAKVDFVALRRLALPWPGGDA